MAAKSATAKLNIKDLLTSAGYSPSNFNGEECSAIFDKVAELVTLGRSQEEAVMAAVSICTPSKARPQATGSFEADAAGGVKIRGGAYRWTDTKDGYFTLHDVPLISEIPEGTKGAPEPVNKAYLEHLVRVAQERYNVGSFCGRAFINHHKDIELNPPKFVGYVLPNRVGMYRLEDELGKMVDRWTAFGNLKVNAAAFEQIKRGELPGTSVELPWSKKRISGVALLGSRPPHFEYANLTLGEQITGSESATFEAKHDPIFDEDTMTFEEMMAKLTATIDSKLGNFSQELEAKLTAKFAAKADDTKAKEEKTEKTDDAGKGVLPVEPNTKTKTEDAGFDAEKVVAMFGERDAKIASLEARDKARTEAEAKRAEEAAKSDRILKAEAELKGLILSADVKKDLASFAHDEKLLGVYVTSLKKNAQKAPPLSMADFKGEPVQATDKSVAAFAAMGPEATEKAAKFAAEHREMKRLGWPVGRTEEEYVKFRMTA